MSNYLSDIDLSMVKKLAKHFNRTITFYDLETTNFLSADDFAIVELALVNIYPHGLVEEKTSLINPQWPIPKQASDIHHITNEMVANAPCITKFIPYLRNMIANNVVSGFNNIDFDNNGLKKEFKRFNEPCPEYVHTIDVRTMYMMDTNCANGQKGKLEEVAHHYGLSLKGNAHRASYDIALTVLIAEHLLKKNGLEMALKPEASMMGKAYYFKNRNNLPKNNFLSAKDRQDLSKTLGNTVQSPSILESERINDISEKLVNPNFGAKHKIILPQLRKETPALPLITIREVTPEAQMEALKNYQTNISNADGIDHSKSSWNTSKSNLVIEPLSNKDNQEDMTQLSFDFFMDMNVTTIPENDIKRFDENIHETIKNTQMLNSSVLNQENSVEDLKPNSLVENTESMTSDEPILESQVLTNTVPASKNSTDEVSILDLEEEKIIKEAVFKALLELPDEVCTIKQIAQKSGVSFFRVPYILNLLIEEKAEQHPLFLSKIAVPDIQDYLHKTLRRVCLRVWQSNESFGKIKLLWDYYQEEAKKSTGVEVDFIQLKVALVTHLKKNKDYFQIHGLKKTEEEVVATNLEIKKASTVVIAESNVTSSHITQQEVENVIKEMDVKLVNQKMRKRATSKKTYSHVEITQEPEVHL